MSEARYYVTKEPSTDLTLLNGIIAGLEQWLIEAQTGGPPPINESISGVNPDKIWIIYRRHINGKEALYG